MALRNKIFIACESLLRVPPLLVVDEIFRHNFGLSQEKWSGSPDGVVLKGENVQIPEIIPPSPSSFASSLLLLVTGGSGIVNETVFSSHESDQYGSHWDSSHLVSLGFGELDLVDSGIGDVLKLFKFIFFLQIFAAALVVFVLSTKNLVKLYSYLFAFSSIYISYYLTPLPLTALRWDIAPFLLVNIVIRGTLAGIYFLTRSWPGGYSEDLKKDPVRTTVFNTLDALMFSLFFISGVVRLHGVLYISLVVFLQASLWTVLPKLYNFLRLSWEDTKRTRYEFGISHLIQVESGRLRINAVFRLFWISRALYDAFYQLPDQSIPDILRHVMTNGSETLPGIIGLTVTVSAVAHQIGAVLLWILYHGTNSDADVNRFGSISTVLFFILCLQTGLTSLDPEKRLDRLFKNVVLLATALFHALHQMVVPLLHAFRSFQALQIRAVLLSVIFLCVSLWSSVVILRSSIVSTWSVAVLALALEFKIKILVSLLISVFVYFSQRVTTPELLQRIMAALRTVLPASVVRVFAHLYDTVGHDDIVFYLKSFSHSAEFLTGIFLFVNAVWIFLFESASAIRAIGMGIHAYFNIWCEGKKGWRIYCQRRTASKKIESLADASEEQLAEKRDDVCAICYEEMDSAKVTLCGHLFHAVCLRKWLYVQNTCPLCHEILYAEDVVDETVDQRNGDNGEQQEPHQAQGIQAQPVLLNNNNSNQFITPAILRPVSDNEFEDTESDFDEDEEEIMRTLQRRASLNYGMQSLSGISSGFHSRSNRGHFIPRHRIQLNSASNGDESTDDDVETDHGQL